jgi:hypothetical protein
MITKKYLKNCRQLFPIYGKYEKQFLKRLQKQVDEYLHEFSDSTYENLCDEFGSPKDIVISYYDTVETNYLLKKTNLIKNIRIFLFGLLFIICLFLGYRTYIIYQAYLDSQDTVIIHEETIIQEN